MATTPITRAVQTTGNNWSVLASAPDNINSVVATPTGGSTTISLALRRGGVDRFIQGPVTISQTSTVRTPVIALQPGDTLVARSAQPVDFVAGGFLQT